MAGESLVSLGLEQAAPAPRPSPPTQDLTDIIVCAAAEACRGTPAELRAPLLAAFRKARQLGLEYEEIASALEARLANASTPGPTRPGEPLGDVSAKTRSKSTS